MSIYKEKLTLNEAGKTENETGETRAEESTKEIITL